MSREIKFRFYDEYLKEMSYYKLDQLLNGKFYPLHLHNGKLKGSVHTMQYTGLKDRNGKEIYEGDMLLDSLGNKDAVIFLDGEYVLDNGVMDQLCEFEIKEWELEVVGNIYENPELLEK